MAIHGTWLPFPLRCFPLPSFSNFDQMQTGSNFYCISKLYFGTQAIQHDQSISRMRFGNIILFLIAILILSMPPQHPLDENVTATTDRTQRNRKPSARARELQAGGEAVPGLLASSRSDSDLLLKQTSTRTNPTSRPTYRLINPDGSAELLQASGPMASLSISPFPRLHHAMPDFSAKTFMIYDWPRPIPTDFLALTDEQYQWKQTEDARNARAIANDDTLEWTDFAGRAQYYPSANAEYARECAIARNFVHRAKRAYMRGRAWAEFEREEDAIDPAAEARQELDLERRRVLKGEALDNTVRMAVFARIKGRLRREIWLEDWAGRNGGTIRPQQLDSVQGNDVSAASQGVRFNESASNDCKEDRTVRGWGLDSEAYPYPLWKDQGSDTELADTDDALDEIGQETEFD